MYHSRPSYKKFRQRKKCEHVWRKFHVRTGHAVRDTVFYLYKSKLKRYWLFYPDKLDTRNMKRALRFHNSNRERYLRKIAIDEFRKSPWNMRPGNSTYGMTAKI